jgi:predicted phage terminase large subunit-like protein
LRAGISGLIPVNPKGDKLARARAVVGYIEAGNVYLPTGKLWTAHLLDECASFPPKAGGHDDQVDATSQALIRWTSGAGTVQVLSSLPAAARPTW